jgi:hypothetical protein
MAGATRPPERSDLLRLCAELNRLERAIDELGPQEDLREWVVVRVNDEITVDLMTAACGVTFAEARDAFILRAIGALDIPFASRDLMIRLKQGNREKDRIDLEYLLRSGESGS